MAVNGSTAYDADQSFRERFARESGRARVGGLTAQVVDADPAADPPWLVTAYVPSLPLDRAVREHGPLPEPSLRVLAAGLAEALTEIHRVGLIHRDLKPGNVLLAEDGPRVIDFGIARATEGTAATQSIIGTPGFMSPEQVQGAPLTPKSDMFAYGAVLVYAARVGPFGGAMPTMVMRVLQHEPDLSGVPESLRGLVAACLAKDERNRPSPGDVLDALGDVPVGSSWLPPVFMRGIQDQVARMNAALSGAPATEGDATAVLGTQSGGYAATECWGITGDAGDHYSRGPTPTSRRRCSTRETGREARTPPTAVYGQNGGTDRRPRCTDRTRAGGPADRGNAACDRAPAVPRRRLRHRTGTRLQQNGDAGNRRIAPRAEEQERQRYEEQRRAQEIEQQRYEERAARGELASPAAPERPLRRAAELWASETAPC